MSDYYVLNEAGEAVPVASFAEWARWFETNRDARVIGKTTVGEAEVSTVFLGMDPIIFETMIFEGQWDQYLWRWSTRAQAVAGHDQIVAALREGKSPDEAVSS